MRAPRFTIAGLMLLTLFVGIAVAALRSASDEWASVLFALTLGMLATAVLGALFRSGQPRAFWTGFAVFGWGYLFLCFGPWCATEVKPHLASTKLLEYVYPRLAQQQSHQMAVELNSFRNTYSLNSITLAAAPDQGQRTAHVTQVQAPQPPQFVTIALVLATPEPFQRVGHSLLALVFAYLGGLVARYFSIAPGERDAPEPRPQQSH